MTVSASLLLIMFVALLAGLLIGTPLAYVLGGVAVIIGYIGWGTSTFSIIMSQTFGVMNNYTLIAIPMFVLMANFLTYSGVADGLFEAVRKLFGPVKGGLAAAVMVVSAVFAATTGVVGASVLTMGLLALPVLDKNKYDHGLATGTVCAGGSLGILIPPSIMLVTLASLAQVSLSKLLLCCFVPGGILAVVYIIYILVTCAIHPEKGPAMSKEEFKKLNKAVLIKDILVNLIPPLILILGVLGTIFMGVATPTEASACGALLALILTFFYKSFSWKMLKESVIGCLKTSAMCFFIMIAANSFCAIFFALGGDTMIENFGCLCRHRQVGLLHLYDGSHILHGHVHRLDRHRCHSCSHFPAYPHRYGLREYSLAVHLHRGHHADLLHDAALRLCTFLCQGAAPEGIHDARSL